jgi:hypothetical protein
MTRLTDVPRCCTRNFSPGDDPEDQDQDQDRDQDVTTWALARWDRTARLCAIRLTEAVPTVAPLVFWLALRR